jgi:hypothetical protein
MCPGGRPGLQNQWQATQSRLRWVRLPRLPASPEPGSPILLTCNDKMAHRTGSFIDRNSKTTFFLQLAAHMPIEIPLFDADETLRFDRIVLYPYPDLTRIWTRLWITAVQDETPSVEVRIYNPDGTENTSVFLMSQSDQRIETTLHLREPKPGATYHVRAELTTGMAETLAVQDVQEFDMALEFRNPETPEPGFGIGVDWDEVSRKAQE